MCINKIEALVYFYQGRWNEIFLGEEYTYFCQNNVDKGKILKLGELRKHY